MRKLLHLIIYVALFAALFACSNDDDFSSDGNLTLKFSADKIRFDTVFSHIGSATKQFKIYNRSDKSLVISSIQIMNPDKSGFRMNIDGEKGTSLSNVEILKKDSLFGFIEVTVNAEAENPLLIRDSIRFETNGNIQYLQLEAVGQDVYIWKGGRITRDTVILSKKPLLVYDSIIINKGVTATFQEGAKIFFRNNASMRIYGTLKANGSIQKPVIFRGDRFDRIEGDILYDNVPGQWDGIYFCPESFNNELLNVNIRNATRGITFHDSGIKNKKAVLTNTVVQNTAEYGVKATNCKIEGGNCRFVNSKGAALEVIGGAYTFLHCTIANYYQWDRRIAESLLISNTISAPLEKCEFINSIIYGPAIDELYIQMLASNTFNYKFANCLIKATEITRSEFINTIWNADPQFKNLNTSGDYSYNFELTDGSPAINKADKAYSTSLPSDLKGQSRLDNPDIGCYEWIR
ncbi:choice-of-anchor Q domain-containing protein [Prevotella sp. 10(H)]|uniref:choice-of-anchor Q domain-containing protein n=1 Tax=Prevotella sp. 10(H) TaxID=1158294 RepID=UPI0005600CA3|nr:choice-of-anchor Q domain-containing protein [Prevotella sp. 10(H)]